MWTYEVDNTTLIGYYLEFNVFWRPLRFYSWKDFVNPCIDIRLLNFDWNKFMASRITNSRHCVEQGYIYIFYLARLNFVPSALSLYLRMIIRGTSYAVAMSQYSIRRILIGFRRLFCFDHGFDVKLSNINSQLSSLYSLSLVSTCVSCYTSIPVSVVVVRGYSYFLASTTSRRIEPNPIAESLQKVIET